MEQPEDTPDATPFGRRFRADMYALGAFAILLGAILAYWFINDDWLAEYDIMSYFLPWYGHLGGRLRAFDIPGWMPWLSSGSPVAGDPSGGWWYLPVMLSFSSLGVTAAFKAMILIQTLISGIAVYGSLPLHWATAHRRPPEYRCLRVRPPSRRSDVVRDRRGTSFRLASRGAPWGRVLVEVVPAARPRCLVVLHWSRHQPNRGLVARACTTGY